MEYNHETRAVEIAATRVHYQLNGARPKAISLCAVK